jgi:predicted exporter
MPSRRFFAILLAWLAVIAAAFVASVLLGRVTTDLARLMPGGDAPEERLLLGQLRAGPASRLILVALGGDADDLAAISRRLRFTLAQDPAFSLVENGALRPGDPGLETLFSLRYLLGPGTACRDDLQGERLKLALEARLRELTGPLPPPDSKRLAADPTACFRALLQARRPATEPRRIRGVWFTKDGAMALMVAQTRAPASDLEAQERAVDSIREAFDRSAPGSRTTLQIAGPGYFAVGSRDAIRAETARLSLLGSILVLLILLAAFRNLWLALLGTLPLASGILAGILTVQGWFGYIHGIAVAMGLTLLGVALDYPLHVIGHARFGDRPALRAIWSTLFLGALTTALGYLALTLTDFEGLAQLGVLAGTGVLVAALASSFLLPPMLEAIPRQGRERRRGLGRFDKLPAPGRLALVAAALVSALMFVVLAALGVPLETDLRRLSSVPPADIALDQRLRGELGAPDVSRLYYHWADDPEQALRDQEQIRPALEAMVTTGRIAGFEAASLVLPSIQAQRLRQARLPDSRALGADLERALKYLPFRSEAFAPFVAAVAAAKEAEPATLASLRETPAGAKLAPLLMPVDERWLALVPIIGLVDAESIPPPPAGMHYIDLTAASSALLDRFLAATLSKVEISAAVIWLVLLVGLRNLGRLGRMLVVISLAVQLDLVSVILLDDQINLFHLVALLLVLGLSIDYSLFFTRPGLTPEERSTTFTAIVLCALSSFAMFALLGLSSIPVLHAIGSTVAIGIALAFFLSWMFASPAPESRSERRGVRSTSG